MKYRLNTAAALLSLSCCWLPGATAQDLYTWPAGKPASLSGTSAREIRVVNVWATWCAPCRKEMPMLSQWYRKQQKNQKKLPVSVIGIAVDSKENLARFSREVKVAYPLWQYRGADSRVWMKSLGNTVGALPFTQVGVPGCAYRKTLLGVIDTAKLDKAVAEVSRSCLK